MTEEKFLEMVKQHVNSWCAAVCPVTLHPQESAEGVSLLVVAHYQSPLLGTCVLNNPITYTGVESEDDIEDALSDISIEIIKWLEAYENGEYDNTLQEG